MICSPRRSAVLSVLILVLGALRLPLTVPAIAAPTLGALVVTAVDADGHRLPNACFVAFVNNGGQRGVGYGQCDRHDANPSNGQVIIGNLTPGPYFLMEDRAPAGYALVKDRSVTVTAGVQTKVNVRHTPGGSIVVVTTVDPNGAALPSSVTCYTVIRSVGGVPTGEWVASGCDGYDSLDGKSRIVGLPIGTYFVGENTPPPGYLRSESLKPFTVATTGATVRVTVVNQPILSGSKLTIRKVDPDGHAVTGGCFQLSYPDANGNPAQPAGYNTCDGADGTLDGKTVFPNVAPGRYVAFEVGNPPGWEVAPIKVFTKVAGSAKVLTFVVKPGGTTLKVTAKNGAGTKIQGACFSAHIVTDSGDRYVTASCDERDGASDGVTQLYGLPAGNYLVNEWRTPSGYAAPPAKQTSIAAGTVSKSISVTHLALAASAQSPDAAPTATPTAMRGTTSPVATVGATPSPTARSTVEATPTEATAVSPTATEVSTSESAPAETPVPTATTDAQPTDAGTPEATAD